jgi:hypothetical protein
MRAGTTAAVDAVMPNTLVKNLAAVFPLVTGTLMLVGCIGANAPNGDGTGDQLLGESCQCTSCGCDGDGDDGDDGHDDSGGHHGVDVATIDIDASIHVSTTAGLSLIDPGCGLISLNAAVDASVAATAELHGNTLVVTAIDVASLALQLGNGCRCSPLLDLTVVLDARVDVDVQVSLDACKNVCGKSGSGGDCVSRCNRPGNRLTATVNLDASVHAELDLDAPDLGLGCLLGRELDIDALVVVDAHGNVIL